MINAGGPVPLPGASIPEGVPGWTSKGAERWVALCPPRWCRPLWPALVALVAALAAAFLPDPGPACSSADPCGPDWLGMSTWVLLLGQVLWSLRFPELVLLTSPVLIAVVVAETFPLPSGAAYAAVTGAVLAASAAAWAAAGWRLAARRRQRLTAERTAGAALHRVPGAETAPLRGTIRIAVALVLLGVALGTVGMALRGVHEDARRAKAAAHLTGQVLQTGDVSIRLRTAGATHTVNAWSPQDYKPGQRVDVLVDRSWARLAAEPYDPVGWQMLTLSTVLPALTLLPSGIRARRRDAKLLRRPVPALRAVLVFDRRGDAWVRPTDGAGTRPPLLRFWVEPLSKKAGDEAAERSPAPGRPVGPADVDADAQNAEDLGDEDRAWVRGRPREVLIYGAPQAGAPVLLVAAVPGQGPAALRTGSLRLARPGALPQTDDPRVVRIPRA
ncbi:hypothetical protein K4749_11695 [Streptomyces sp. TRM72054]|uniref:hypothetical protein n=1 Tax=Streptomyces sp. TRM72054 TaxID=2870562 RepID=UPI001C8BF448|nr:hypothetical protein [Streptomyces sp. TRM72054]MBX9394244.1 hypothetical protein [Streptomyces sp. TRM72054]